MHPEQLTKPFLPACFEWRIKEVSCLGILRDCGSDLVIPEAQRQRPCQCDRERWGLDPRSPGPQSGLSPDFSGAMASYFPGVTHRGPRPPSPRAALNEGSGHQTRLLGTVRGGGSNGNNDAEARTLTAPAWAEHPAALPCWESSAPTRGRRHQGPSDTPKVTQ